MEAASLNISHRHDMRTRWKDIFHTVDMCSWCIRLVWFNMIQDHLILFNLIHFCSIRYSILLRRIQHDLIFFNTIQHHSMSISFNISFFSEVPSNIIQHEHTTLTYANHQNGAVSINNSQAALKSPGNSFSFLTLSALFCAFSTSYVHGATPVD